MAKKKPTRRPTKIGKKKKVSKAGGQRLHGIPARSRNSALVIAAASDGIDVIQKLLDEGADINCFSDSETPLLAAVRRSRIPGVKLLVEAGADLNLPDRHLNYTPLMKACGGDGVRAQKVALLLIDAGADVRYSTPTSKTTALMVAAGRSTPQVVQALIDHKARVNGPRGADRTPLIWAAMYNDDPNVARVLVDNGASLSRRDKDRGLTALEYAEDHGSQRMASYLRRASNK